MRSWVERGLHPLGIAASEFTKTPGKALIGGLQLATLQPRGCGPGVALGPRGSST